MTPVPNVIVKKGGFFTAIANGVFGLLTAAVVCASGLGVYSLHVLDKRFGDIRSVGESVALGLPHLRESLPPVLSDAINDRRAADYLDHVSVKVKLVDAHRRGTQRAVVEVTNNGDETISLLSLNLRLEDEDNVPIRSFVTYAATPLALPDDEWRGPILPGASRKFACPVWAEDGEAVTAAAEVSDLRVAKEPPAEKATAETAEVAKKDDR
ncbi:MAG: hypothetical protein HZB38_01435 [Planctomycetes bacterium]|nr:hypothetical protein [Planctomycetota bacterium]